MPVKNAQIKETTLAVHKQMSYEQLVAAWLMCDGWEVLVPLLDHGKKTDLVIADESNYYRIQVKSIESADESIKVENKWRNAKIDFVIYFSRTGNWGYIAKAFSQAHKSLNSPDHIKFFPHQTNFLKAFKKI